MVFRLVEVVRFFQTYFTSTFRKEMEDVYKRQLHTCVYVFVSNHVNKNAKLLIISEIN